MTPELERIGKILVEAEGGCWHEEKEYCDGIPFIKNNKKYCKKCKEWVNIVNACDFNFYYPNFSQWANFDRLLKIADNNNVDMAIYLSNRNINFWKNGILAKSLVCKSYDQIPLLVATELARIIKDKR